MGKISDETKREIIASTDIVELIGRHVKLRRAGSDWKGLCPFHNEKTPSFSVSQTRGRFHCFGCGESGDAISFVQKYENIPFPEALKTLADRAGIRIVEDAFDPESAAREKLRSQLKQVHRAATDWFHELLLRDRGPAAQEARNYLRKRGIDIEVAKRWKLGFAPPGQALGAWAQKAGYPIPLLIQGGLMAESRDRRGEFYPYFRNRLMIPIEDDVTKEVIAFSGRSLTPDIKGMKYVNSSESLIFKKSKVLFGLSRTKRAISRARTAIVCEGQLDLITCVEFGVENVVASQGTAFTELHAKLLKRSAEDGVILCFDADSAGYKAAEKAFGTLSAAQVNVRVIAMPPGQDPDSMIRTEGPEAFRALIEKAQDFFDFQIDHLSENTDLTTTRGRIAFSRKMAESAAELESPVARDTIIHRVASRLHITEDGFRDEVKRAAGRSRAKNQNEDVTARPPSTMGASKTVVTLCRMALTESGIATFLRQEHNSKFLEDLPGTGLLSKIWAADFDAENPEEVSIFIDNLPPEESSLAGALVLSSEGPPQTKNDALLYLTRLEKDRVSVLISQTQTQLDAPDIHRQPDLLQELQREKACLVKELADLNACIHTLSQMRPNSDS